MPIGVLINAACVLVGGVIGGAVGSRVPERIKKSMTLGFGVAAAALGITLIMKFHSIPVAVLAFVIGTIIGEFINIEDKVSRLCGLVQKNLMKGKGGMQDAAAPEEKDVSYTVGVVNEADIETVAESELSYAGVKEASEAEPAEMPAEAIDPSREEEDGMLEAVPQMVADYPGNYETACYVAPAGGETGYSQPLQDAMAEYHDAVTYRVYADIFRSGEETPMAGNDPEVAALLEALTRDYGIETALEPYTGADGKKQMLPVLHATFDQLRRFPAFEGYGWMLFLYDEKTE